MKYETDRSEDTAGEPSLAEMTTKAIEVLKKNRKGYYLMVEGGRIDHAHHAGNAARALADTIALSDAVRAAAAATDPRDTLILVTAGTGLGMGEALVAAQDRPRSLALAEAGRSALVVLLGCLPWFLLLGVVESFVSPVPAIPEALKLALGLALESLFLTLAWNPFLEEET